MSTVSDDLLPELLSLLPSRDLLRFRCVSKSWLALIDSPYFIQLHLNKSLKDINSRKALAVPLYLPSNKFLFYAISLDSEFKISVTREIKPPIQNFSVLEHIGSCRSLICLSFNIGNGNHKIVLWNPSRRSHRILPLAPAEIGGKKGKKYYFRHAFGYDEVADDYKVVRLTFNYRNADYEAEVYSFRLDTWKEIDKVALPSLPFLNLSYPIFVNGAIIWLMKARERHGYSETAFSFLVFPLRTKALHSVSFPKDLNEFGFEFKQFSSSYRLYSCYIRNCLCPFRDLFKLINNKKFDTLRSLLLPDSNINEGMDYLKDLFHDNLCSELRSFKENLWENLHPEEHINMCWENTCCWVDSLFRVERSNSRRKTRRAKRLVESTKAKGEDYKRER